MNDRDDHRLDELERLLREEREPPPERIALLRAQAEEHRRATSAGLTAPPQGIGRRRLLFGAGAASLGALAGAGGFALTDDDPIAAPPAEAVAVETDDRGIRAQAQLVNHTWGVEYQLRADGLTPGRKYRVFYETTGGDRLSAGSFQGTEGPVVCNMTASVVREQVAGIEVLAGRDEVVMRTRLT